eukprot:TRINITY_DN51355_c0_g1_i1.p1 TRINITY_DN51355_c0_g1~~TRINITY_DN51355_c0_g1_i1.p1  ORF type:complete len:486 (+),score=50.91 TRINITY_DN51355_c0_g1_i1:205-1458(+)
MEGSNHHIIRGADFQKKAWDFYGGVAAPAPLEESFWILSLPENMQSVIAKECPAMLTLAYLVVAEVKLHLDTETAFEFAGIGSSIFQALEPRLASYVRESWPIDEAFNRIKQAYKGVIQTQAAVAPQGLSVDFVVAHCHEDLSWLSTMLPHWGPPEGRTRVFVYEKCGKRADVSAVDSGGARVNVKFVPVVDGPPGGRKDECSAYLTHLLDVVRTGDVAHYTVFLQADAFNHVQPRLFDLVMRAIRLNTFDVPFVHLSRARMVSSTSPCKRAIYQQVMGVPPSMMQIGYCCAHFIARRDVVMRRGAQGWERTLAAMDSLPSEGCEHVRAGAGMHCLTFESMWHVMFGMPDRLSPRAEDMSLPIFLRIPEMDGSDLPGASNSTMYFRQSSDDGSDWIDQLEIASEDVTGARSIGYINA